jgi:hypothetical protein
MILSDGTTWQPKGAQTHTNELMEKVNAILQAENIRDDNNELIQLSANFANAFYLMALAIGQKMAEMDTDLQKGLESMVVELCDDQQIENLLPIAGIDRNTGSYSTLVLTCTASTSNACTIPAGTKAPFGDYYFVTQAEVTIPAGESAQVYTVCDTVGPVVVLTGEVDHFETTIANLDNVINNESSIPGTSAETTDELRRRLERGDSINAGTTGLKYALEASHGIAYARVYFNYNLDATITLPGSVVLQPRTAYIVVYGDSPESAGIAALYARYMNAPTQNAPGATTTAYSEDYVTASGQIIPVYYDTATETEIYIKIYLESGAASGSEVQTALKQDLIASSAEWEIGGALTSTVLNKPFVDIDYTKVAYVKVSDNGINWDDLLVIGCNEVPRIQDANITVEELV